MSEQRKPATDAEILQILIAEHSNLQSVRSTTSYEANGRTNLFLGTVSSALIALAFIGQVSGMNGAFILIALILLPSLFFIGVVTFIRVYQSGIEDILAGRGINRIRHYYTEVAPQMKKYFIFSTHDDIPGVFWNMGIEGSPWQLLVSAAGLVSVINGILAAVFVGMLMSAVFNAALAVCVAVGAAIFALCVYAMSRYQIARSNSINKAVDVLFPSEEIVERAN